MSIKNIKISMKKIIFLAVMAISTLATQAQTLDKFFEKYSEDERFSYVVVGGDMVNTAKAIAGADKNDKMPKVNAVKILSLENSSDEKLKKEIVTEITSILENNHYIKTLETREKGERVKIYSRNNGKNDSETVIISVEKKEVSIVWTRDNGSKNGKGFVSDNNLFFPDSLSINN